MACVDMAFEVMANIAIVIAYAVMAYVGMAYVANL